MGLSIDGRAWLELHIPREQALRLDYEALVKSFPQLEIYGAQDYLTDFYHVGMEAQAVLNRVESSGEKEIHLCFFLESGDEKNVSEQLKYLSRQGIFLPGTASF